eukprot:comp17207_c0_seq1/m.16151 comp17207_c0_seq1/g.16151  ORF comp17207_c0_seq1/g.16151 comp17207_c0_seq1/m.16151 type:complete len:602 (-) comp17207_c0_seq1:225-2030(-)
MASGRPLSTAWARCVSRVCASARARLHRHTPPLNWPSQAGRALVWGAVRSGGHRGAGWAMPGWLLLAAGPVAVCKQHTPADGSLCHAVLMGDETAVRRLVESGHSPNEKHPLGWAPLHVAVVQGNNRMARLLLSLGADPNIEDTYSVTDAVGKGGYPHMIEVVRTRAMEFSRQIHPQNNTKGFTALHYAALLDNLELVQALLDHGANPLQKNADGHLPSDYVDEGETPNGSAILRLLDSAQTAYALRMEEEEKEMRRRFPLEARLKENIVGQLGAINTVAAAVRRKENGWQDEDRPLVFLFLGSSGIGKTEMAKRLAQYLHPGKKEAFIRLDMSEFQSKHEVSKFIGSPPGYVGHEEGGQLTEKLRACPNAVVLFDEVEKAHPDVLTIMLQLFDEGRLTDGKGQTIDCKDATFIMTSNLAQDEIAAYGLELRKVADRQRAETLANAAAAKGDTENADIGESYMEVSRSFRDHVVRPILKAHFQRNEFLGRINEIVYFLPFSDSELKALVAFELRKWAEKAKDRHGVELTWDPAVETTLISGYDVHYGARSLKYEVDRRVINLLAAGWEQGTIAHGSKVHVYMDGDNMRIKIEAGKKKGFFG